MDRPDMESAGRWLRDVEVRPVRGVEERRRWDALMARHHYLPFHGLFGKSLRHVAVRGETWLALLGWQAGAFKVGVRDAWIGWSREQQFSRLHLIANNSRFAVLEEGRVPNLASRALGPSLRRLARDMRDAHGHPVLLAETFVDPSRFAGTCYRASNWRSLGRTRGYSREPGGSARWRENGRPKEVFVYEMEKDAPAALCCGELPGDWRAGAGAAPPSPPDMLDRTLSAWVRQRSDGAAPVAMDGKDVRGASRQIDGERRMMVAAVEHGTGLVPGQVQVGDKTNEIPAVRELTRALGLKGRMVTLDAMHAQHETARALVEDCGADYVVTAVKDNQPTMFDDLRAIDWRGARRVDGGWEKAHGRLERRSCAVLDIGGPEWDGYGDLHGRRQAFRIERERRLVKQGAGSRETVYGLTSLGAGQAGPEELAALVRRHWHIENRLHYVRDFTYDEDRCRVRVGNLPRNLACLTNAAISIVRHAGRFAHLPPANRHYAARPQEALDAVPTPPSG